MKIKEQFLSIQGEGRWVGTPAIFIRTSGCVLQCPMCDTKYAWEDEGQEILTEDDAYNYILTKILPISKDIRKIVITGGEPLMAENFTPMQHLTKLLRRFGYIIQFETIGLEQIDDINGCNIINFFNTYDNLGDIYVVSPKLESEAYSQIISPDAPVLESWIFDYYTFDAEDHPGIELDYKFVYTKRHEPIISSFISYFRTHDSIENDNIFIMPYTPISGNVDEIVKSYKETAEFCKLNNLRYSPRLQVDIWGTSERGV